jgi:TPR repeat protein
MSFLPRLRFGRDREAEVLRQRVRALEAALKRSSERPNQWTLKREVAAAIAVVILAAGFTLGVYRDPIKQSVVGVARVVGIAKERADPYASYNNGDYRTALRLARVLADENDARAQSLMGLMFYRGQGVSRDYTEAAKWFRLAADQGDVDAQFYLGVMYSDGLGVPEDYAEGARWYRLAADQGEPQAQYNLGVYYSKAQLGGRPDFVSAYMWFNLAAAHFKPSDPRRNTAINSRELVEKQMTAEQLAEAQKRAREWTPAGA